MTSSFLHGVQVVTVNDGSRPISVASTSVIGIVGTAPNADPNVFPLNTPVLVSGSQTMAASLTALNLGADNGTLPDAIDSIFKQALAVLVVIRVAEGPTGANDPQTLANVLGGVSSVNGQFEGMQAFLAAQSICGVKPRILIAPGFTHQQAINGVIGIHATTAGAGLTNGTYPLTITDSAGGTGSGAAATATVTNGAVSAVTITNPGHGYTTPTAALPAAAGVPTTAPVFSVNVGLATNAVVASLVPIANSLRAIIVQDGPNTTDSAALLTATYSGSQRVYLVDPGVIKTDTSGDIINSYASAVAAGVIAYTDNAFGWWYSPSNKPVNGIQGTQRAIPFSLGDLTCSANVLNAGNVTTIIRQSGFLLWGNRTLSSDPRWQFLCVVRTADIIADTLQAAHMWAVDQGITKNYVTEVVEGVNNALRQFTKQGAILGGTCWCDPDLNPANAISNGEVFFDFDFTPAYPAEDVTFRMHLVNDYITSIF